MPKLMLLFVAVVSLLFTPLALADCEYCGGTGGNRVCKDVNSSHPGGNDNCQTGLLGECTYKGNSCSSGGANCTAGGICEEFQSLFGLEPAPGSEAIPKSDDASICRLPGLTIEA